MYYSILVSSALFTAGQFVFLKLYQRKMGANVYSALVFSVFIGAFQAVFSFIANGFMAHFSLFSVIMAALFALCVVLCNTLGIKVMKLGKISVYTLFMMLGGMIVPFFYGVIFLNEKLKLTAIAAVFLLIASLCIPSFEKDDISKQRSRLFYPLCCLLFCVNGAVSTVSKAHQISDKAVGTFDYMIIIGLSELLIASAALIFVKHDKPIAEVIKMKKGL